MRLSRIRVEQFKQFRQSLEIKDLDPGINLFAGPNEAGKSTIVLAIRAAFFERHRSGSVDELRPRGDSSASPTVEIDFAIGDAHYRLKKSFLNRKRCELQIGMQTLDGAQAEDRLAELLGFDYAGRGASSAEHWGIPGLLWVQQGAAQDLQDSVAFASNHLRGALNESLGEVASSSGDAVLASVEAQRNELLTPAGGKPRGVYDEALKREAALAAEIQQLETEIASYREQVDTLATLRREHARDETDKPWTKLRDQEREAREALDAIRGVEALLANEKLLAGQLSKQIELQRGELETFAKQEAALSARRSEREAKEADLAAARLLVQQWDTKRKEAEAVHERAREGLRLARQEDARLSLSRQFQDTRRNLESHRAALEKSEVELARIRDLQMKAAASEIELKDLQKLRELDRNLQDIRIRQDAAATRLRFALTEGSRIRIGDATVAGTGERLLIEPALLVLPGLGEIEVFPGGGDLSELRRQEADLSDQFAHALQQHGLPSLENAEARYATHTELTAEIRSAQASLSGLAPEGIEALRTAVATERARMEELEDKLKQLPAPPDSGFVAPAVSEAESAEESARATLTATEAERHQAQLTAGNAQTAFDQATRELSDAAALVDTPGRADRVAAANQNLVDALAQQITRNARIGELTGQIEQAHPDILEQDVERFRKSAEQLEREHGERATRLIRLEVELQSVGAKGLEERRAERIRDREQNDRRVGELRRRAEALNYLLALLREKRQVLTQRLQAPLQLHLNRYLQLLFPHASLQLDENLSPGPLTRAGTNGPETGDFESLSFGAREQMGVLSRLAYADFLQEAGRPTLIILDDALVHSDEERLAQMKRLLFNAAIRHQILLFTCHPANWRDLGVSTRSLDSLKVPAG